MRKIRIGFVGVGCISGIYLKNITHLFREIEIIGVCDLIRERAEKAVAEYAIPKLYNDMYELFNDPDVDIVLNITRPYEHYEVTKQALLHGKHVYSEKPLAPDLEQARELFHLAEEKGLYLGGAPDTFMGAGLQTARQMIDNGFIGQPIGAAAHMISRGPESWHPDPESFYRYGGGPMLDMGPYYTTALVNMLGRVEAVSGMAQMSYPTRPILSEPKYGNWMDVSVPTYVMGQLKFASGAVGSLFTTFDVSYEKGCKLEIYGSEGTLILPDPNTFGGPLQIIRGRNKEIIDLPLLYNYPENSRGLGLADMAKAIQTGRKHRAGSQQQLHVVETMLGILKSSEEGKWIDIESDYERPALLKRDGLPGIID